MGFRGFASRGFTKTTVDSTVVFAFGALRIQTDHPMVQVSNAFRASNQCNRASDPFTSISWPWLS
jgi:hypothetical protein